MSSGFRVLEFRVRSDVQGFGVDGAGVVVEFCSIRVLQGSIGV